MPRSMPSPRTSVQPLDDGAVGLASALTHRLVAVAAARGLQLIQQRAHQAHAAGPQRVADGDGTTTRVEALHVVGKLLLPHERNGRKGLVAFDRVELVD